ncbi:MAG TPA: hypothetical protein VK203_24345 [Nostocaceae cyanobacterium]|nr:hypothetical protein [Nostocaceae cyanobacterium]
MLETIIIALIAFAILWKVIKTTINNALIVVTILFLLYTGFGITPLDVWHQITQVAQTLSQGPIGK